MGAYSVKHSSQLRRFQNGRRSAAQVNRVHFRVDAAAHLRRYVPRILNIAHNPIHIAREYGARKHVGSEVAVAALRLAERYRNVNPQTHPSIIPSQTFSILPGVPAIYLRYPVGGAGSARPPVRPSPVPENQWPRKKKY